jgi:hypothetical protein
MLSCLVWFLLASQIGEFFLPHPVQAYHWFSNHRATYKISQWNILPYINNGRSCAFVKYDTSAGFRRDNTVTKGWQSVFIIWITYCSPWSEYKTATFPLKRHTITTHAARWEGHKYDLLSCSNARVKVTRGFLRELQIFSRLLRPRLSNLV